MPSRRMVHILCCGGAVAEAVEMEVKMFRWEHFGLSVNLMTSELIIRINNVVSKFMISVHKTDNTVQPWAPQLPVSRRRRRFA